MPAPVEPTTLADGRTTGADGHPTQSDGTTVFLKLGGSLITDKSRPYAARRAVIRRLAGEIRSALDGLPACRLLLGHGSGSFGHWAARPHGTREGVRTPDQWRGYAEVAAAAARLNRIVADTLLEVGVPILSVQPSASARCHAGELVRMDTHTIRVALDRGLVPLVHGDVALDDAIGGTIVSTEDLFIYLADEFQPARVLLVGQAPGVLKDGGVVPSIGPGDLPALREALVGSDGVDVTGGMADKIMQMLKLVERHPATCVHILSGSKPGVLAHVLLDAFLMLGTRIGACC